MDSMYSVKGIILHASIWYLFSFGKHMCAGVYLGL